MILEFHQRLSILAKDSVKALDRFPVRSEKDDIYQTNIYAHCYESSAANLASLQKASRNLPNVIQREEMLQRKSRGQRPFQSDLVTKDPMLQILEKVVLDQRDQRHRPQDHRHEQEDADVVDARLASIRRSWRALGGHSGTLATIASRDNRATVKQVRRSCVSGGGTTRPP